MPEGFYISEQDAVRIKALLDAFESGRLDPLVQQRPVERYPPIETLLGVLLADVPPRVGLVPGVGTAEPFGIDTTATDPQFKGVLDDRQIPVTVLNLFPNPLPAGDLDALIRDSESGQYIALGPPKCDPILVFTGVPMCAADGTTTVVMAPVWLSILGGCLSITPATIQPLSCSGSPGGSGSQCTPPASVCVTAFGGTGSCACWNGASVEIQGIGSPPVYSGTLTGCGGKTLPFTMGQATDPASPNFPDIVVCTTPPGGGGGGGGGGGVGCLPKLGACPPGYTIVGNQCCPPQMQRPTGRALTGGFGYRALGGGGGFIPGPGCWCIGTPTLTGFSYGWECVLAATQLSLGAVVFDGPYTDYQVATGQGIPSSSPCFQGGSGGPPPPPPPPPPNCITIPIVNYDCLASPLVIPVSGTSCGGNPADSFFLRITPGPCPTGTGGGGGQPPPGIMSGGCPATVLPARLIANVTGLGACTSLGGAYQILNNSTTGGGASLEVWSVTQTVGAQKVTVAMMSSAGRISGFLAVDGVPVINGAKADSVNCPGALFTFTNGGNGYQGGACSGPSNVVSFSVQPP